MKIVIIEDEQLAADRLQQLILTARPHAQILKRIDSVEDSVAYFSANTTIDLIFMDIHLADGNAFEIFSAITVPAPVIFTTAFDHYALKAFKVNSIDYILKPVEPDQLTKAIEKFELKQTLPYSPNQWQQVIDTIQTSQKNYKERFIIKVGEHLKSIATIDIAYFVSEDKFTYLTIHSGQKYIIDQPLEKLEVILNPKEFFRISRKYMIALTAIEDIVSFSSSRLKLKLKNTQRDDIIVARERVNEFKDWLDR